MRATASAAAAFVLLSLGIPAQGRTWQVPGDAGTIQGGLTLAAAGDTVLVASGTYHEHDITLKSGVTLRSETGEADCVTIDGDLAGRVLYGSALSNTTRLEGFTITRGRRTSTSNSYGGGFYGSAVLLAVTRCSFVNNSAVCTTSTAGTAAGGGVYLTSGSNPVFTDCAFTSNQASASAASGYTSYAKGGGVHCGNSDPQFIRCTIADNRLASNGGGGTVIMRGEGLNCETGADLALSASILASNTVYCASSTVTLSCSDADPATLYTDCLAGQQGVNGNFSADPLFCDRVGGDYHLDIDSPCANAPGCGRVGAHDVGCGQPVVWHVPGDVPTLAIALAGAADGDTIEIACGIYYEHDLVVYPSVVIRSETRAPDCVTIDAGGLGRVLTFDRPGGIPGLVGITVTGGLVSGGTGLGGGIMVYDASPLLQDCLLAGNRAIDGAQGGAIGCLSNAAAPTLQRCTIVANEAPAGLGGGIYCYGAGSPGPEVRLDSTIVAFNQGGAVACGTGGNPVLSCSDVYGNAGGDYVGCLAGQLGLRENFTEDPQFCDPPASNYQLRSTSPCADRPSCGQVGALGIGCQHVARTWFVSTTGSDSLGAGTVEDPFATVGYAMSHAFPGDTVQAACGTYPEHDISVTAGVYLRSETGLPDCVTIGAAGQGRVLYCEGSDARTRIEGLTLRGGSATQGAGAYCLDSDARFLRCVLASNTASAGGALFLSGSDVSLRSCTLAENSAAMGSGIYAADHDLASSDAKLDSCIVAFGQVGAAAVCEGESRVGLDCSDVYGNAGGDYVGCLAGHLGNGNISVDPLFCPGTAGEYALHALSPCADAPGCGLLGALGVGCGPRVWHVPADAPTIQAGIDSAFVADTVLVACGTYVEHDIAMKSGVFLVAEPGCVTIDAQSQGRVLACESLTDPVEIRGFTLTGGNASLGAGIWCQASTVTLAECSFTGNTASGSGAGVYAEGDATLTLTDCTFTNNLASVSGGALEAYYPGALALTRCTFSENRAQSGAAISIISDSPVALDSSVLDRNAAASNGGGIVMGGYGPLTLTNCTLSGNQVTNAGGAGGGIFMGQPAPPLTIANSIIAFSPLGDAVVCQAGTATVTCTDIFGNAGGDWTGGIADQGSIGGNFSADPGFCDHQAGVLTLCDESPCLPEHNTCGVFVGALGAGNCSCSQCGVLTVPQEYPTIAAALGAAAFCDTVLVSPGLYAENLVLPWGVTLLSLEGPEATVIDGGANAPAVSIGYAAPPSGSRDAPPATLEGFTLRGGYALGIASILGCNPAIRECLFTGNLNGPALLCPRDASPVVSRCTFYENGAPGRPCVDAGPDCSPQLDHCIIAFNFGIAAACYAGGSISISCSDVFGNEYNWANCIESQQGQNGNLSVDPMFCDREGDDLHLRADSPCADESGCGRMGAFEVACVPRTWFVATTGSDETGDGSAPNPFATIAHAYAHAYAADTIRVAAGTYSAGGIQAESGVYLRSETGLPDCVTLDAQGSNYILRFNAATSATRVAGFTFRDGYSSMGGAIVLYSSSSPWIENCAFESCQAGLGGAVFCRDNAAPTFVQCAFTDNSAGQFGGALYSQDAARPTLRYCTFVGNSAYYHGGAAYCVGGAPSFDHCTLYENAASGLGGGLYLGCGAAAPITGTIIAFSTDGEAVYSGGVAPAITCTDIFGNAGGDWTGSISDQQGVNGNLRADPLFCDRETDDLHLRSNSPCADAPGCGAIGALGVGCFPRTWFVATTGSDQTGDGSPPNPFATIAHAYTHAYPADTIQVAAGTYSTTGVQAESGVYLRSETGLPDCVTLDAHGSNYIMRFMSAASDTRVEGFTFRNGVYQYGGALSLNASSVWIENCAFESNVAQLGGAIMCTGTAAPTLSHCSLTGNSAASYGGGLYSEGYVTLRYCTFVRNAAMWGGAACCVTAPPSVDHCTLYDNSASQHGAGLYLGSGSPASVASTIIAYSSAGEAVYSGGAAPAITCTDIFGNADGDWTGSISDQQNVNGNMSADPLFCDRETDDLHLRSNSPCADAPGCGAIGALGVGCYPQTWFVATTGSDQTGDGSAPNPFATIAHAYAHAYPADTIQVACGTYHEHAIPVESGVCLRSETGLPECVIIDGDGASCVLYLYAVDASASIEGFTLRDGYSYYGAGAHCTNSSPRFTRCAFVSNHAQQAGGAVDCQYGSSPQFTECSFLENSSSTAGGGIYAAYGSHPVLSYCTFGGTLGSVAYMLYSTLSLDHSTLAGNREGILLDNSTLTADRVIIAFNDAHPPVACGNGSSATLTCCDVYGNDGGDWTGCIADQQGVNGNFSLDPLFCDESAGDLHLAAGSPCRNAPECGLVGALGRGCSFLITSVTDVGNDQGRQVRLRWENSPHDGPGMDPQVTSYDIYRRIDLARKGPGPAAPVDSGGSRVYPPGEWDFVKTVPAHGEDQYSTLCPTLCDSTLSEGMCWSVFFVRAGTTDPLVFYDSDPDSGYSVDNLSPGVPGNLRYSSPSVLAWDESTAPDFDYFTIYGSAQSEFDPSDVELIARTAETTLDVSGSPFAYYHVTATDFAGNEGGPASIEGQPQSVTDLPGIPRAYMLYACRPSPSHAAVTIRYDLPQPTPTRLQILDTTGRAVRTLVDDPRQGAGRCVATWDGCDRGGRPVAAGMYFCRLDAGSYHATRSVLIMR